MTREQIIETMARGINAATECALDWDDTNVVYRDNIRAQAFSALVSLEVAGFLVVPKEPTDRMIGAAIMADRPPLRKITVGDVLKAEYTAMVKAALNPERGISG